MNRGLFVCLLVLRLSVMNQVSAQEEMEDPIVPEELGVSTVNQESYEVDRLVLPGEVEDWAALREDVLEPALVVVAREGAAEDDPLALYVWRLGERSEWHRLGVELPASLDAVGSYPGNGPDSTRLILVFADSTLLIVSEDGQRSRSVSMPNGFFPITTSRWARQTGSPDLDLVFRRLGALEKLSLSSDWSSVETEWSVKLPVSVDRVWRGLSLETPPVVRLTTDENENTRFLVGPEAHGLHRLRSLMVEVDAEHEPAITEIWSMFSGPETVLESWYVVFNRKPGLLVTTVQADKHGVFEKKKIRLFLLDRDRSRSGAPPILEAITRSRNWYAICAGIADLNNDGLDDVVSAQPQGLGAGKLWVTAHLSDRDGSFESKPLGTMLEISDGERCNFDFDFDENGQPDLMVVDGDDVLIFPLTHGTESVGRGVVAQTPDWRIELEDVRGTPRLVRLFRDRRPQIIATGLTEADQGRLSVVRFE